MINPVNILHDATRALYPTAITVRGYDIDSITAYDANEKEININKTKLVTKYAELEAAAESAEQAAEASKQSALNKLAAIGLTPEEIAAILG